jgi:hypothetical protein
VVRKKVSKKVGFQYPKLLLFLVIVLISYVLFQDKAVFQIDLLLEQIGYFGIFVAGCLYTFGFTGPVAAVLFLSMSVPNVVLAGIVGGLGAMVGDLFIFSFIKFSFEDEFVRLRGTKFVCAAGKVIESVVGKENVVALRWAFAAFVIGSPLPDEAGLILVAGFTRMTKKQIAIMSFLFNTIGITFLLLLRA